MTTASYARETRPCIGEKRASWGRSQHILGGAHGPARHPTNDGTTAQLRVPVARTDRIKATAGSADVCLGRLYQRVREEVKQREGMGKVAEKGALINTKVKSPRQNPSARAARGTRPHRRMGRRPCALGLCWTPPAMPVFLGTVRSCDSAHSAVCRRAQGGEAEPMQSDEREVASRAGSAEERLGGAAQQPSTQRSSVAMRGRSCGVEAMRRTFHGAGLRQLACHQSAERVGPAAPGLSAADALGSITAPFESPATVHESQQLVLRDGA